MTGTAVEYVEAQDMEARKHLNRVLVTADQLASASMVLRADLRGKTQDVRAIALTLDQHGLPVTIQNVNACFVVNGAVEFMTRLWSGLAMARGHHRVWVCDADPEKCKCEAPSSTTEGRAHLQRGDDGMTYTATFSWADAERAGLTKSATYTKFPQDMLGWRALSRVVKRYAPDIVIGVGEAVPDTVSRARPRPPAFDKPEQDEPQDITDAELVEQGEDINHVELVKKDAGPKIAAAPPGPAVDGAQQTTAPAGDRETVSHTAAHEGGAGEQLVGSPAPAPGPVDWREVAKTHGVTVPGLLRQARDFAGARALPLPETLEEITDEQVVADVRDWLGEPS